jgi:hypothetical protein
VLSSPNLLTATDPTEITWELLPSGDIGIRLDDESYEKFNFEEAHVIPMVGAGAPGFYIEGRTTNGCVCVCVCVCVYVYVYVCVCVCVVCVCVCVCYY